jgi:hypothetical protein
VQIEEAVAKVVRELGHPALAQAYTDAARQNDRPAPLRLLDQSEAAPAQLSVPLSTNVSLAELTEACSRAFSLEHVFSRDIAAAHRDGLVTLTGLESPFELGGCVLDPGLAPWEPVARASRAAGSFVGLDSPDYSIAERPEELSRYVKDLCLALQTVGLRGLVNLNSGFAPSWVSPSVGPLFSESAYAAGRLSRGAAAHSLRSAFLAEDLSHSVFEFQWHFGAPDIDLLHEDLNRHILGLPLDGVPISFAFDRPDLRVSLAPGIDRQNPALLLVVHLNLPRLAVQLAGAPNAAALFLQKLGSLVRLALSAGIQKRDFLRKYGTDKERLESGFLLDRARLLVAPVGIDSVIATLLGTSLKDEPKGLEFARRILERLFHVVSEDSRTRHLAVGLDGGYLTTPPLSAASNPPLLSIKDQARVAAALHAVADLQTATLHIPESTASIVDEMVEVIRWLWQRSNVRQVRFSKSAAMNRQLPFA